MLNSGERLSFQLWRQQGPQGGVKACSGAGGNAVCVAVKGFNLGEEMGDKQGPHVRRKERQVWVGKQERVPLSPVSLSYGVKNPVSIGSGMGREMDSWMGQDRWS